jgi:hypothetical protein
MLGHSFSGTEKETWIIRNAFHKAREQLGQRYEQLVEISVAHLCLAAKAAVLSRMPAAQLSEHMPTPRTIGKRRLPILIITVSSVLR